MYFENAKTVVIDDEALPWMPFLPYSEAVHVKYIKLDPVRGEMVVLMRSESDFKLPRHQRSGACMTYTLAGRWSHAGESWIAGPGSVVFDFATATHASEALQGTGPVITFNVIAGDIVFLTEAGEVWGVENWRTGMQRYLDYCAASSIEPMDISSMW